MLPSSRHTLSRYQRYRRCSDVRMARTAHWALKVSAELSIAQLCDHDVIGARSAAPRRDPGFAPRQATGPRPQIGRVEYERRSNLASLPHHPAAAQAADSFCKLIGHCSLVSLITRRPCTTSQAPHGASNVKAKPQTESSRAAKSGEALILNDVSALRNFFAILIRCRQC